MQDLVGHKKGSEWQRMSLQARKRSAGALTTAEDMFMISFSIRSKMPHIYGQSFQMIPILGGISEADLHMLNQHNALQIFSTHFWIFVVIYVTKLEKSRLILIKKKIIQPNRRVQRPQEGRLSQTDRGPQLDV